MVKITQGDVYWYDFAEPWGDEHPVVVVQGDASRRTTIGTAVCVILTSNVRLASAAGNVLLPKKDTGLKIRFGRQHLSDPDGRAHLSARPRWPPSPSKVDAILRGIDIVLGR